MKAVLEIYGRLGKDPERDVTKDGKERVRFSVAVSRFVKKGEDYATDWFDCVAFGATGTYICENLHKGSRIFLRGDYTSYRGTKDPSKIYWNISVNDFEDIDRKSRKAETAEASSAPGFEDGSDIPF